MTTLKSNQQQKKNTVKTVAIQQEQLSANSTNKSNSLTPEKDERSKQTFTRTPITNTPFTKIWVEGKGYAIALDGQRLTEWVKTNTEINKKIEKGGLTLAEITTLIYVLVEDIQVQKEFTEGLKNKN